MFYFLLLLAVPRVFATVPLEVAPSETAPVHFSIPYTLGTHRGEAVALQGEASWDPKSRTLASGHITVLLSDLKTGGEKQDCHLTEALGLDYTRSAYPQSHACESNKLPAHGPDSVAFPDIRFEWKKSRATPLGLELLGGWIIHGTLRVGTTLANITVLAEKPWRVRVQGQQGFELEEFGIQVKPFLFVSVDKLAQAEFDFQLREKTQ